MSNYYDGKNVDFGILKKEFPPELPWFENCKMLLDLGFVGFAKLYPSKELVIGEKKPRKSKKNPKPELSEAQKSKNRAVSKVRIFVEHAIGRIKKYHILKNRCRLKIGTLKNRILGITAGLWNYQLDLKG